MLYIMWEGEARREGIIKWSPPEGQLGLTIHQTRPSSIKITNLEEIEKDSPPKEQILLGRLEINHQGHKVEGRGR